MLIMAKIGYIIATAHYDKLKADRQWMQEYGCVKIVEENDADEKSRPLRKQLMVALERGDELVFSKFRNALRGARELAMLLAKATQTIPLGTAYPVWTGIGAVGAVSIGIFVFREPATFWRLFFLTTLIGSIIGLKALS